MTAADLVIEALADREVELLERVASLEDDGRAYRELAQQAIHTVHRLTVTLDRLRAQHHRLIDQYRARRGHRPHEAA